MGFLGFRVSLDDRGARRRPAIATSIAPSIAPVRWTVAAALLAGVLPGCVQRKLVIRSDPPGALVSLEDEPLGVPTPVEVPFEYDGVRRVTLTAPGHRVLETRADLATRWYDHFPLDFVAAFLWPGTIEDVQEFEYRLEPYAVSLDRPFTEEERAALRARMEALSFRADEHRRGGAEGPDGATAEPGARPAEAPPPEEPPPAETK